jgi:hypothetical protein
MTWSSPSPALFLLFSLLQLNKTPPKKSTNTNEITDKKIHRYFRAIFIDQINSIANSIGISVGKYRQNPR